MCNSCQAAILPALSRWSAYLDGLRMAAKQRDDIDWATAANLILERSEKFNDELIKHGVNKSRNCLCEQKEKCMGEYVRGRLPLLQRGGR